MLNYKKVKSEIALALLTLNTNNSLSSSDIVKYTDEIALLNRKRESLIADKMALQRQIKTLTTVKSTDSCQLSKIHALFEQKRYQEAKEGYLNLMTNNNFYDFLKINIQLCDKRIREK